MGTKAKLLAWADAQVGHVGGEKYWREAFGWSGNGWPWCAVFCSDALKQTDTECKWFPSTVAFDRSNMDIIGDRWVEPYDLQAGDMVAFSWKNNPWSGDHVGIIREKLGNGYYKTVEGNVSDSCGIRYRRVSDGIIGGIRPFYSENVFTDVDDSTPHHVDIKWLKDNGIAKGYADGSYRPSAPLTRADCSTFLHRLAGTRIFTDVPDSSDISWMAVKGISQGFPDGTFRPNDAVKRADMAAFLYRMAGCPEFDDSSSFADVDDATPHAEAIRWLGSTGISKGYADGTFKPMAVLTRGDAAAFIRRAAAYVR